MSKRFFLFIVIFLSVFNIFYFYKKSKNEERVLAEEKQRKLEIIHKYHVEMEINDRRSELVPSNNLTVTSHEVSKIKNITGTDFTKDQMNELLAKEVAARLSTIDLRVPEFQNERNQINDWLKEIYQTKKMVFFAQSSVRAIDVFDVMLFLDISKCPGAKLSGSETTYKDFCLKANAYLFNQNTKKGEEKWYQYNTGINASNLLWDFDIPSMPIFLAMDVELTRLLRLQIPMPSFNGPLFYYHLGNDKILWDKNENFSWEESTALEQKEFEQNIVNKNLSAVCWKKYKQEKKRLSK